MPGDPQDHLDLYHRTSIEIAAQIRAAKSMISKENTQEVFFSTHPDQQITDYGEALVHIRIPRAWVEQEWARLDDEFALDDGTYEEHYAIEARRLGPEHFID